MKLEKVTITGADDSTTISDLVALSAEFPFVEWGILVSKSLEGTPRFPSRPWMTDFSQAAREHGFNVSTHICGRWVRDLLIGTLDWSALPAVFAVAQRVQINIHAMPVEATTDLLERLWEQEAKQFIIQCHVSGNEHFISGLHTWGVKTAALFDASGGLGKLPDEWPTPHFPFQCGFAGGLGPENVLAQLDRISAVCPSDYLTWVDMERHVRAPDDSALDLTLVRSVLEQVQKAAWV